MAIFGVLSKPSALLSKKPVDWELSRLGMASHIQFIFKIVMRQKIDDWVWVMRREIKTHRNDSFPILSYFNISLYRWFFPWKSIIWFLPSFLFQPKTVLSCHRFEFIFDVQAVCIKQRCNPDEIEIIRSIVQNNGNVNICRSEGKYTFRPFESLPCTTSVLFAGWNRALNELKVDSYISHYFNVIDSSHTTSSTRRH